MREGKQPAFHNSLFVSALLALFFLQIPSNSCRAEFLDDLFDDDTAPTRSGSISRGHHEYSGGSPKYKAAKLSSTRQRTAPQYKMPNSNLILQKTYGEELREKMEKNEVKFALCNEQAFQKDAPKKSDAYLYDRNLRRGDSVMTPNGLRIFKGTKSCPHQPEEFVSLSDANTPKNNKKALSVIDEAAKANWR